MCSIILQILAIIGDWSGRLAIRIFNAIKRANTAYSLILLTIALFALIDSCLLLWNSIYGSFIKRILIKLIFVRHVT